MVKPKNEVEREFRKVCEEVADMLIHKNRAYGNSAFKPMRVFSKASDIEAIHVRLDDKISRIARGSYSGEDPEWDIMGYLVIKRVALRLAERKTVKTIIRSNRKPLKFPKVNNKVGTPWGLKKKGKA